MERLGSGDKNVRHVHHYVSNNKNPIKVVSKLEIEAPLKKEIENLSK